MIMKIGIIGLGYVGLTTGLGLTKLGHEIYGYEIDTRRRTAISNGIMPIYEEGLEEVLLESLNKSFFLVNVLKDVLEKTESIFICVPTPSNEDGSINTSFVFNVAKEIGKSLNSIKNTPVVIVKSTVIPGVTREVKKIILNELESFNRQIDVAMVPEFLRQGVAYKDFINPDRVVFGVESEGSRGEAVLQEIFQSYTCKKIVVDLETAEFSKYASNSFLALKITFANELANVVDAFNLQQEGRNVNVDNIVEIMGLDKRINKQFLGAGPGYGGSCFPKDVKALSSFSRSIEKPFSLLETVTRSNRQQAHIVVEHAKKILGSLENKKIGLLGLAFKPNTDDVREAPAKEIIKLLQNENAELFAWDPKAEENMEKEFPLIKYNDTIEDLEAYNLDLGILITDWQELKSYFKEKKQLPYKVLDTRRIGINTKTAIGNMRY